jgi:class 3 adenylate cyclase
VAFTYIVSSTEQVASSGDDAWRSVLDAHERLVEDRVSAYGGTVVKGMGDGHLLRFSGPARALHCLLELCEEAALTGLQLRAGVHTGECELRADDVAGIAVHVAARVSALAGPGQVLTTTTVRDLVAGSSLRFTSGGWHVLKGLGDPRELLAVHLP